MATRSGPPTSLDGGYGSRTTERLERFATVARSVRAADDDAVADRVDRLRGLGCPSGDMRLAYGWRAAVVTAAVVGAVAWLVARAALTGLFVRFVTGGVVPVTGFNVAVTVVATLALGLVRARRFRLGVHHRLVPVRRRLRRRVGRWRRERRRLRRHRRSRLASRCLQARRALSRGLRDRIRRGRRRRAPVVARYRRVLTRRRRTVRTWRRRRGRRRRERVATLRRRLLGLAVGVRRRVRSVRGRLRRAHRGATRRRRTARGVALALLLGR